MDPEQYAVPRPRRPALVRAGAALAPALVLCAVAGVVGQVHRLYTGYQGGASGNDASGQGASSSMALRVGIMLADPSTTGPTLAPALAVLALAGLHLLRGRTAPVVDAVRRAAAAAAGVVGAVSFALAVVVVWWVLTTHGTVGGDGATGTTAAGDGFDASFQLDPWDTLLGQGATALLASVVGAGAALLLTTSAAAPGGPGRRVDPGEGTTPAPSTTTATPAAGAQAGADDVSGGSSSGPPRELPRPATAPAVPAVVLAAPPVVDRAAFRRPRPVTASDPSHPSDPSVPAGRTAEGYRRPTAQSRDST